MGDDKFLARLKDLEDLIVGAYEGTVTMVEAERLAGVFLHAQLEVSNKLAAKDLDARMRKSGVKAVRAAIYLDEVQKNDKKPSDVLLNAKVDANDLVTGEQGRLDEAEVERDSLERYYSIFGNAHIFYRGIAKGNFGG